MGNFNRGGGRPGGGGFGRSFGGGGGNRFGGGGGRDGGRPQMHKAVCSECGADCEVPFRPTGDRPVFCNACFDKQGGGDSRPNRFEGGRRDKPRFDDKQMHDATCAKCGKSCQVPFRPVAGKPVYCNDCFDKDGGKGGKDSGEIMTQLKMLNSKIETLIRTLTPNASPKKAESIGSVKETPAKTVVEKKVKVKAKTAVKKVTAKKKK